MKKIILASMSAQRREYFRMLFGNDFETVESGFEEDNTLKVPPEKLAVINAAGKARKASERYDAGIIIGADTFVYIGGRVLGKPKTMAEARDMLSFQSGKTVNVYTGVAIVEMPRKIEMSGYEVTKVRFTLLSDSEIKKYVGTGEWKGKAGGWTNLGKAGMFIDRIEGCMSNVAGLPLSRLYKMLKEFGVDVLK